MSVYDPSLEKDNCGFGLIAHQEGEASHKLVRVAISSLDRMQHRGGIAADGKTGDGCGLLMQKPDSFFRAIAVENNWNLGNNYAVGMIFLNPIQEEAARSKRILEEELQAFNWIEVDEYPSFSTCDEMVSKEERTLCFQETITETITRFLQKERIVVEQDINDTILLKFQVSNKGKLVLLEAEIDSITTQEIPNIKELLGKSLDSLPKIFPAIKRGQHVTTEFKLPIVILVN